MRWHGVPCTRAPVEACRGEGASACRLKVWESCDSNKITHRGRDPEPGSGPDPKRCACILVVLAVQLPELAAERVPRLAARIRRGDKVRRGFKQQTLAPSSSLDLTQSGAPALLLNCRSVCRCLPYETQQITAGRRVLY